MVGVVVIIAAVVGLLVWLGFSDAEDKHAGRRKVADRIPEARLIWSRDERLHHTRLSEWAPKAITPADVDARRPRWSPNGQRIVYERDNQVWIMDADFKNRREVLRNAHTADWDGTNRGITAITDGGYKVVHHHLVNGKTEVIYDARQRPWDGNPVSQGAELHPEGRYLLLFKEEPYHSTVVADLENGRYISNKQMRRGDCKPAWSPDGTEILTTARTTDRPVLITSFDYNKGTVGPSRFLIGLDSVMRYYAHDARLSNDGRWVVFGGKQLVGATTWGGREIYIWERGAPQSERARLTFAGAEDEEPSLFIPDT